MGWGREASEYFENSLGMYILKYREEEGRKRDKGKKWVGGEELTAIDSCTRSIW